MIDRWLSAASGAKIEKAPGEPEAPSGNGAGNTGSALTTNREGTAAMADGAIASNLDVRPEEHGANSPSIPTHPQPTTDAQERYARARRLDGLLPERVLRPIRLRALNDMLDAREPK